MKADKNDLDKLLKLEYETFRSNLSTPVLPERRKFQRKSVKTGADWIGVALAAVCLVTMYPYLYTQRDKVGEMSVILQALEDPQALEDGREYSFRFQEGMRAQFYNLYSK